MELYKQFPNFLLLPPQNILEDILEHHESMNGVTLNLRDLTRLRKQPYKPPLPSLFLTNARSIANKMDELRLLAATNFAGRDSCILLVTETWLHSSIPDSRYNVMIGPVTPVKAGEGDYVCTFITTGELTY